MVRHLPLEFVHICLGAIGECAPPESLGDGIQQAVFMPQKEKLVQSM
jgi:hypothetical protein